jgi:hypothetical protein
MKTYRNDIYNHTFTNSSFIEKASWFNEGNILMLTFATGSVWQYYDVPFEIYSGFIKAPSHGKYFNENIRNTYSGERVYYTSEV